MSPSRYTDRLTSGLRRSAVDASNDTSSQRTNNATDTDFRTRASNSRIQQEPEDAALTGGTRSLSRRLLALNLPMVPQLKSAARDQTVRAVASHRKPTTSTRIPESAA